LGTRVYKVRRRGGGANFDGIEYGNKKKATVLNKKQRKKKKDIQKKKNRKISKQKKNNTRANVRGKAHFHHSFVFYFKGFGFCFCIRRCGGFCVDVFILLLKGGRRGQLRT